MAVTGRGFPPCSFSASGAGKGRPGVQPLARCAAFRGGAAALSAADRASPWPSRFCRSGPAVPPAVTPHDCFPPFRTEGVGLGVPRFPPSRCSAPVSAERSAGAEGSAAERGGSGRARSRPDGSPPGPGRGWALWARVRPPRQTGRITRGFGGAREAGRGSPAQQP